MIVFFLLYSALLNCYAITLCLWQIVYAVADVLLAFRPLCDTADACVPH